jgi:isopenicillin N synthase-like dioxygenase
MRARTGVDLISYRDGPTGKVRGGLHRACRDIDSSSIGHGVPDDLIAEMEEVSTEFFDLPSAETMKVGRPASGALRGYIPILEENLARSRGAQAPADLNSPS